MPYVWYFARVFAQNAHAEAFVKGRLYANRVSYFRKIEDDPDRGDKYEAAQLLNPVKMTVTPSDPRFKGPKDPIHITPSDLVGPVALHPNIYNNCNMLCLYAAYVTEEEAGYLGSGHPKQLDQFLRPPRQMSELGNHAVVISDPVAFLRRVRKAALDKGYSYKADFVEYYDPEHQPYVKDPFDSKLVFMKRRNYDYQREFRILIDTHTRGCDAIELDVGGLGRMAHRVDFSQISS